MIFPESLRKTPASRKISVLTAAAIDGQVLSCSTIGYLSAFTFHRLRWRPVRKHPETGEMREEDFTQSLLNGLYALDARFCFLVSAAPGGIRILIGTEPGSKAGAHRAMLEGIWGPGTLNEDSTTASEIQRLGGEALFGAMTGDPAPAPRRPMGSAPVDRWIRGLQRERWSYLIDCIPVSRERIAEHTAFVLAEIGTQQVGAPAHVLRAGKRSSEQYQLLLETSLKRLESARLNGAWQVGTYFFARNETTIREGLGLIASSFAGSSQAVQPLRTHLCKPSGSQPASMTILGSTEVAALVSIPREEVPGYELRITAAFDTDGTDRTEGLHLGRIVKQTALTGNDLRIPVPDLTRHGLVAGVTGSGKTTTCFSILEQLRDLDIPFLVIESAKSEYRQLLCHDRFRDLLVFTLGDETPGRSAPFRLNPFEVPRGVLVQTHLDHLKSLFRASFVMYAPMPYVLEEALYDVYRDRGWNLSSNANERGTGDGMFPTLTDLHAKIGEVVARLGYDDRISRDILAGLRTRVNNLRLGGKGLMLDTSHSLPFDEILQRPVLLELKKLGSDEEKAFLIGLVLTRLYEHYEVAAEGAAPTGALKHLTLVEEAHRLLAHVPESAGEHDGSARGKAVETFCNMLAEIRAYGEGVLVSEQIPTKLARDVIKNSGVKVMHRIVARDDRDVMGDAMNMNAEQKAFVTTLDRGQAVVYAEKMDSPFLVSMELPKFLANPAGDPPLTSERLARHMKDAFYSRHDGLLLRYAACQGCGRQGADCGPLQESIRELGATDRAREIYDRFLTDLAFAQGTEGILDNLDRMLLERASGGGAEELRHARWCLLVQVAELAFESQGRLYKHTFDDVERLRKAFLAAAEPLVTDVGGDDARRALFREMLEMMRRREDRPFAGCGPCNRVCLSRFEAGRVARSKEFRMNLKYALTKIPDDARMWIELAQIGRRAGIALTHESKGDLRVQLGICCLSQAMSGLRYAPRLQEKVLVNVAKIYQKGIVKTGDEGVRR